MSAKVSLLAVSLAIIVLPYLLWRIPLIRRAAPLAVVQILVGVLLGPSCLGHLAPSFHAAIFTAPVLASLDGVASLGVLLYVFVTGLHLDASNGLNLKRLAPAALGSILVPLAFGLAAGTLMLHLLPEAASSGTPAFLASVAICVAVTALPVLAAILQELGLLGALIGQTALALALLNDAALWIMLAVLLAVAGVHGSGTGGLAGLAVAALWFATLAFAIRPAAVAILARLGPAADQPLLVAGVALAILSAAMSEALGTGYLIGAFAAGVAMPAPCRPALLARLELLTATVLLPFFFMSTGLKALIQPTSPSFLILLAIAVTATILGKLAGTAWPARRMGFTWPESLSLGVMMQTKGLMEVVVLAVLREAGLIGNQVFSVMVAMAVICTIVTAPAVRLLLRRAPARLPQAAVQPPSA